jgi:hypothetical protein
MDAITQRVLPTFKEIPKLEILEQIDSIAKKKGVPPQVAYKIGEFTDSSLVGVGSFLGKKEDEEKKSLPPGHLNTAADAAFNTDNFGGKRSRKRKTRRARRSRKTARK